MITSYAELQDGSRHDIQTEFVSIRPVRIEGEQVRRLVVADENDDTFSLFATADHGVSSDLKVGETYIIENVLVSQLTENNWGYRRVDSGGSRNQENDVPDTVKRVMKRLDVDGLIGIVDGETQIRKH